MLFKWTCAHWVGLVSDAQDFWKKSLKYLLAGFTDSMRACNGGSPPGNTTTVKKRISNVSERLVFSPKRRSWLINYISTMCPKIYKRLYSWQVSTRQRRMGFEMYGFLNSCRKVFPNTISVGFRWFEINNWKPTEIKRLKTVWKRYGLVRVTRVILFSEKELWLQMHNLFQQP